MNFALEVVTSYLKELSQVLGVIQNFLSSICV
jgi:hypothetical protein